MAFSKIILSNLLSLVLTYKILHFTKFIYCCESLAQETLEGISTSLVVEEAKVASQIWFNPITIKIYDPLKQ